LAEAHVRFHLEMIPDYWEEPTPSKEFSRSETPRQGDLPGHI
jgi:hypothetical protein